MGHHNSRLQQPAQTTTPCLAIAFLKIMQLFLRLKEDMARKARGAQEVRRLSIFGHGTSTRHALRPLAFIVADTAFDLRDSARHKNVRKEYDHSIIHDDD